MNTTRQIANDVMIQLKRESARQGRTVSKLVETALRGLFRAESVPVNLAPLPVFHSGGVLVDVADRGVLYRAMDGR